MVDPDVSALADKEAIRELVLLYSRGVDRNDIGLLRSLYTEDAVDNHGDTYRGPAMGFLDFLERAMPRMLYSGHHVCNHLIALAGDHAEGEVYCLANDLLPDGEGGARQQIMCVRYLDRYRRGRDRRWRFTHREVTYDFRNTIPMMQPYAARLAPEDEPGADVLTARLFARGSRA